MGGRGPRRRQWGLWVPVARAHPAGPRRPPPRPLRPPSWAALTCGDEDVLGSWGLRARDGSHLGLQEDPGRPCPAAGSVGAAVRTLNVGWMWVGVPGPLGCT